MDTAELQEILRLHQLWLKNDEGGKRANLQGADLRKANLWGANLWGANLRGAKTDNTILSLTRFQTLEDAIAIGKKIFNEPWDCNKVAQKYNLYKIQGENRAVIAFTEDLAGGFCFVHSRKEIWLWNWICPDPNTVTILWKME